MEKGKSECQQKHKSDRQTEEGTPEDIPEK